MATNICKQEHLLYMLHRFFFFFALTLVYMIINIIKSYYDPKISNVNIRGFSRGKINIMNKYAYLMIRKLLSNSPMYVFHFLWFVVALFDI